MTNEEAIKIIDTGKNFAYDEKYVEAFEIAIKAIKQTTWIPCSERLPNDEDYVLVCYEDGHIRTAYYYIDTNIYPSEFEDCCETGWYNYNEDFMYEQDVIAWMPSPKSYKGERDMTREELIRYGNDYYRDLVNACCGVEEKHKEFVRESIKALEQQPCDKCVYSTKDGYCQYDDITETIPPLTPEEMQECKDIVKKYTPKQEPCNDTVSRQVVKEQMIKYGFHAPDMTVTEFVEDLPPVTPQKYGKWIIIDDCEQFIAKCSECGRLYDSRIISKYPYCHCGAKMQESEE